LLAPTTPTLHPERMNMTTNTKFHPGQIVATRGAAELLDRHGMNSSSVLRRHLQGDWGDVHEEDAEMNNEAISLGNRILSSYPLPEGSRYGEKVWVITESDRSVTTILLPSEY
jgi:hypothetical protein